MEALAGAAIAAGAAIMASGLTGRISWRLADRAAGERRTGELQAALAGFGYALDRLHSEISQLPPPPGRLGRWTTRQTEKLSQFNWLTGFMARWMFGIPAMRALDSFTSASNRLMLIAPESILIVVAEANQLLADLDRRETEEWRGAWLAMRERYLLESRAVLNADRGSSVRPT